MGKAVNTRLPSLDGLRAFSIICVVFSHLNNRFFTLDGSLGVRIFFVISGFIITTLLLQEEQRDRKISLSNFYKRRAIRIFPVLWAYLAVIAVLGETGRIPQFNFAGDIIRPATFTVGLHVWPRTMIWEVRHTWSLTVEEQFYIFWPMILVLLPKRGRLLFSTAIIPLGIYARWFIYLHPLCNLSWTIVANADIITWGCFAAIVRFNHPAVVTRMIEWRPAIGRVIALCTIEFSYWYFHRAFARKYPPLSTNVLTNSVHAAASAYLILSLVEIRKGLLYRLANFKPVAYIGVISYSIYLWQQLFLGDLFKWPFNLLLAFVAGSLSFFIIERPLRRYVRLGRMPGHVTHCRPSN